MLSILVAQIVVQVLAQFDTLDKLTNVQNPSDVVWALIGLGLLVGAIALVGWQQRRNLEQKLAVERKHNEEKLKVETDALRSQIEEQARQQDIANQKFVREQAEDFKRQLQDQREDAKRQEGVFQGQINDLQGQLDRSRQRVETISNDANRKEGEYQEQIRQLSEQQETLQGRYDTMMSDYGGVVTLREQERDQAISQRDAAMTERDHYKQLYQVTDEQLQKAKERITFYVQAFEDFQISAEPSAGDDRTGADTDAFSSRDRPAQPTGEHGISTDSSDGGPAADTGVDVDSGSAEPGG